MKAAVLHQYDTKLKNPDFVVWEEIPEPELKGDTDVLVRIGGAGVCRTDLHIIEGIWREKVNVQLPYVMGHENAGWVEEIGRGVEGFKKGDPVICHPLIKLQRPGRQTRPRHACGRERVPWDQHQWRLCRTTAHRCEFAH